MMAQSVCFLFPCHRCYQLPQRHAARLSCRAKVVLKMIPEQRDNAALRVSPAATIPPHQHLVHEALFN
jgi:hypothetical protein